MPTELPRYQNDLCRFLGMFVYNSFFHFTHTISLLTVYMFV